MSRVEAIPNAETRILIQRLLAQVAALTKKVKDLETRVITLEQA